MYGDSGRWLTAGLIALGLLGAMFFGMVGGAKLVHDKAIRAGVAEYYLDASGQRVFRWVICEETEIQEGEI